MHTLTKSMIDLGIDELVRCSSLLDVFEEVYLFGSALQKNVTPNDIDLLLVYSCAAKEVSRIISVVRSFLEERINIPIDLTVLSFGELKTTEFLKRIVNYKKLK